MARSILVVLSLVTAASLAYAGALPTAQQEQQKKIYVPDDLHGAMIELDSTLSEKDRAEITALPIREDMIRYHHGLGMWIRNNWGLWAQGSLAHYFLERGTNHPDDMSHTILLHYWDWLHGQRETWKTWEEEHPVQPRR